MKYLFRAGKIVIIFNDVQVIMPGKPTEEGHSTTFIFYKNGQGVNLVGLSDEEVERLISEFVEYWTVQEIGETPPIKYLFRSEKAVIVFNNIQVILPGDPTEEGLPTTIILFKSGNAISVVGLSEEEIERLISEFIEYWTMEEGKDEPEDE
jgi:uncharacterized protein YaaQ